jgi:hypothetical protein
MKRKLLMSGIIALFLLLSGLLLTANPNMKPSDKPAPEQKPAPETKKPDDPPSKDGDLKAKKAFNNAIEKRSKTKGFHFVGKRQTVYTEMNFAIPAEFEGIKDNSQDLLYMAYETKGMSGAQKFELFQKGEKKYTRNTDTEERAEGKAVSPILQADRIKNALENYRFGKDEKNDEHEFAVIEASIKKDGVDKLLADLPKMAALPGNAKITYDKSLFKIWVDKKTSLISRMLFFVEVSATMPSNDPEGEESEAPKKLGRNIVADINLFDYDTNIKIPVPDEIKDELGIKNESSEKE